MKSKIAVLLTLLLCLAVPARAEEYSFDHTLFDRCLQRFVKDGAVDFKALKAKPSLLNLYLSELSDLKVEQYDRFSREAKMAFWINAHNAVTIKLLADAYPLNEVKEVLESNRDFLIFNLKFTRRQIEEEIRSTFRDERIHAALYRGTKSGPQLRGRAYTAETLDQMLDEDARSFINNAELNKIDPKKKKIYISPFFQWYAEDFILNYGQYRGSEEDARRDAVLSFIADYVDPEKRGYIEKGHYKVKYMPYDWDLSESSSGVHAKS